MAADALTSTTWNGRRGPVILGPTEHRVARYLADRTRHGRITIRTTSIAQALRLERSEAYRITARLRVLGLFGIENDRGGTRGGRHIWRTAIEHDAAALNQERHRAAWARVVAWARSSARRSAARLDALRAHHMRANRVTARGSADLQVRAAWSTPAGSPPPESAGTFAERMRRAGLGELMDRWRI